MTTKFINVALKSGNTDQKIKSLNSDMKKLGKTSDGVSKSVDSVTSSFGTLSKVATGVFSGLLINQIVTYTDKFTSLQNQIRQVTTTTNELSQRTSDLLAVSNRARTGISATAELYTQLSLSTKSLNLSTKEQLRLTETISKAFSVSGKTAAESEGAIRQLGQAFSAGALRGDEFNSIAEGAPEILRALERSLKLTTGELRAFAATGGITAEVLTKALGDAASVLDGKISKAVKTFSQSTQEATNNLTVFVGQSEEVNAVVTSAGSAVVFASENIETLGKVLAFSATVLVARMIPSLTAFSLGLRASAASMGVATIAARGLSAGLALLGGPLGVVTLAVSALVIFGKGAEDTEQKTERLTREVDKLADSYSKLNQQQRVIENNKIAKEMDVIREKIDKAYRSMIRIEDFNPFGAERFKTEIRDLNKELDVLSQKQQGLFKSGIDGAGFTDLSQEFIPAEESKTSESSSSTVQSEDISSVRARLALETDALAAELDNRRALKNKEINQQQFDDEAELQRIRFQLEEKRLTIEENEKLTGLQKTQLKLDLGEQEILAEQILQQRLTAEADKGAKDRKKIQEFSSQQILGGISAFSNAYANIESKNQKKSNALRRVSVIADTAAGIQRSLSLNPYDWVNPVAIGLSGAAQLSAIGSSSSQITPSGSSSSSTVPTPAMPTQDNTNQNRAAVVELNLAPDGIYTAAQVELITNTVVEAVSNNDDVVVAINGGQQEGLRTGIIEGT